MRKIVGLVILSAIFGCGGGLKGGARNAAARDFADVSNCPKNKIKTEVLSEKNVDKGHYEADVRVEGCGATEVWNCDYNADGNGGVGEWLCAEKKK